MEPDRANLPTHFLCGGRGISLVKLLKKLAAMNYYGSGSMYACIARAISSRGVNVARYMSLAEVITLAFIKNGLEYHHNGQMYKSKSCASWTGWRNGGENLTGNIHVLSHVLTFSKTAVVAYFDKQCTHYNLENFKREVLEDCNYSVIEIILIGLVFGIPCISQNPGGVECILDHSSGRILFNSGDGASPIATGNDDDMGSNVVRNIPSQFLIRNMFDTFYFTLPDLKVSEVLDSVVSVEDDGIWQSFNDNSDASEY